ncbi:hypothetical protein AMTRI_Chr12g236300 [Amborella trichopoda]
MRARFVIFPIRERSWCFTKSIDKDSGSSPSLFTLKNLWKRITKNEEGVQGKAEIVIEFFSEKKMNDCTVSVSVYLSFQMNRAWVALGKAPDGSFKHKIHGLNPRLVRRRLRHVALRCSTIFWGSIYHRRFFYGLMSLLPFTGALAVSLNWIPALEMAYPWRSIGSVYHHWGLVDELLPLSFQCSNSSYEKAIITLDCTKFHIVRHKYFLQFLDIPRKMFHSCRESISLAFMFQLMYLMTFKDLDPRDVFIPGVLVT